MPKFTKSDGKMIFVVMLGVAAIGALLSATRRYDISRYITNGFGG